MNDESKQTRTGTSYGFGPDGKMSGSVGFIECITSGMSAEIEKARETRQAVRYFTNDFTEVECL